MIRNYGIITNPGQVFLKYERELENGFTYYELDTQRGLSKKICFPEFDKTYYKIASDISYPLYIKAISGTTLTIFTDKDDGVRDLKQKIAVKYGILTDHQRLIYGGRQLDDGRKIMDYGILPEATIYLALRLRGGGTPQSFVNVTQEKGYSGFANRGPPWLVVKKRALSYREMHVR